LRRAHFKCEIRYPGVCTGRADVADHIVAVDEGGLSVIENAQAACRPCNQAKSYLRRMERAGPSASAVPSAADLEDGYMCGCARSQGGPHDLGKWGGPAECYGQPGHASRDWS
jgi:HNH endonuclease